MWVHQTREPMVGLKHEAISSMTRAISTFALKSSPQTCVTVQTFVLSALHMRITSHGTLNNKFLERFLTTFQC